MSQILEIFLSTMLSIKTALSSIKDIAGKILGFNQGGNDQDFTFGLRLNVFKLVFKICNEMIQLSGKLCYLIFIKLANFNFN